MNMTVEYKQSQSEAKTLWERHCHAKYELICVLEGNITITIEGRNFQLTKNHFAVISPLDFHSVSINDSSVYKRVTLLFGEDDIPVPVRDSFAARARTNPVVYHPYNQQIFNQLPDCLDNDGFEPLLQSLLIQLMYIILEGRAKLKVAEPSGKILPVLRYIDENITRKITLDDICKAVFISKSTLCHLFETEMNTTVKQYILQKKIAYADYLLKSGKSAAAVAEEIGYDNYSDFYRIFKKINAQSPVRKKAGSNPK